jgi:hypothetical protein
MPRIFQSKVAWALIGIAFLVFSPVAICGGGIAQASPSHPCCPKPPVPERASTNAGCVCIDRQPAQSSAPSLADTGEVAVEPDAVAAASAEAARPEHRQAERMAHGADQRYLQFHQLLL